MGPRFALKERGPSHISRWDVMLTALSAGRGWRRLLWYPKRIRAARSSSGVGMVSIPDFGLKNEAIWLEVLPCLAVYDQLHPNVTAGFRHVTSLAIQRC